MRISKEVVQIIDNRMKLYEKTYGLQVLMWSFRGSMDVGICRKNSDLDIIFIYRCANKNIRAIHDIVGHGFDYWGWRLEDVVTTICEANKICNNGKTYVLSAEHSRGSLDYYFGVYCGIDNEFSWISDAFSNYVECLREICISKSIIVWFDNRLEKTVKKIAVGEEITGNEYLYSVWNAYMCKHMLNGNKTGDNKLRKLLDLYSTQSEKEQIMSIYNDYKMCESKNAKKYFNDIINDLLLKQHEINRQYIKNGASNVDNRAYQEAVIMLNKYAVF